MLVNDWSARDIQAWEYAAARAVPRQVVPHVDLRLGDAALAARAVPGRGAARRSRRRCPHLDGGRDWALDVELELELNGEIVSRGNARTLYWTMPQQLAHATSNGAALRTGDLMATRDDLRRRAGLGGIADRAEPTAESRPSRTARAPFLEDGDEVVLRGRAGDVELGEVRGRVLPA